MDTIQDKDRYCRRQRSKQASTQAELDYKPTGICLLTTQFAHCVLNTDLAIQSIQINILTRQYYQCCLIHST